jgi:hypothetical protein
MIVDLNPLSYKAVLEVIQWCLDNRVDYEKATALIHAYYAHPVPFMEWTLNIPDEHATWLLLKMA